MYACMSKWPCPQRLKRIACETPSSRQRTASSIAAFTAWFASGAGRIPSIRANSDAGLEDLGLRVGARLDEPELVEVADHRRHPVVAQPARVERRRNERRAEGVHLHERREVAGVAEVEGVQALREARACGRLDRDDADRGLLAQRAADEGERETRRSSSLRRCSR